MINAKLKTTIAPIFLAAALTLYAPQALGADTRQQIISITPLPDRSLQLICESSPSVFLVQAADGFGAAPWRTLVTTVCGNYGTFAFIDHDASNSPARFYRTVSLATNPVPYGLLAKGSISLTGLTPCLVDSFDSSDPNYSVNGRYDPLRHKDTCYVVSASGASHAIQVGTSTIFGYIETATGSGTVILGASGVVGDNNYASNSVNAGTIQMSPVPHYLTNENINIADVTLPSGLTSAPPPVPGRYNVNGTNYDYVLGQYTNYYVSGNFNLPGGMSMIVTNAATLYVAGSFILSGSGFVYIAPGARLSLYVGTNNPSGNDSLIISGGGVCNGTPFARNFAVFGLSSLKTTIISGAAPFVGTSYTPQAALTISGGGGFVGAAIADNITLSSTGFHYDESLSHTAYSENARRRSGPRPD